MRFLVVELQCLKLVDKKEREITGIIDSRKLESGKWNVYLSHPESNGKYDKIFKEYRNFVPSLGETRYNSMRKKAKLIFIGESSDDEKSFKYFSNFGTQEEVKKFIDNYYYQQTIDSSDISIIFSTAIWLLKDSAVSPAQFSLVAFEAGWHSNFNRQVMYTNSLGKFESIKLSNMELETVMSNFILLFPYLALLENNFNEVPSSSQSGDTTFYEIDKALSTKQQSFTKTLLYIQKARLTGDISSKVAHYMSALQGLFAVKTDISFNLSRITASLIAKDDRDKECIIKDIEGAYGIRSEETHGYSEDDKVKIRKISKKIDSYVRRIIKKVFRNYQHVNYIEEIEQKNVREEFMTLALQSFKTDYDNRRNNQEQRRYNGINKNIKNISSKDELEKIKKLIKEKEEEMNL